MSNTPTLAEVLDDAIAAVVGRVPKAIPAKVVTYDDATQRCSAQPLIKQAYVDEDGVRQVESRPIVNDVPVIFPGSGGRRIKWDVIAGDVVLLVYAHGSLDKWLAEGGEVDPIDDRSHSASDAIAIPGLMSSASDASPMIEFTSSQIKLGANAAEGIIKGTSYRAAEDTFLTALGVVIAAAVDLTGIPTASKTAFAAALAAYQTAIAASVSTVSKTE